MSGVDVVARNLARGAMGSVARLRTVDRLRGGIARVGGRLPALAVAPPTIAAQAYGALPAGWTDFTLVSGPSVPAYLDRYTLLGGAWQALGPTFPNYLFFAGLNAHYGNGTDPLTNFVSNPGPRIRFASSAPQLEIGWGDVGTLPQYRLKIDGDYAQVGPTVQNGGGYIRLTWGDGSNSYRKLRRYELECINTKFFGIRAPTSCPPEPWPAEDPLRMIVHGDSMVATLVDSAAPATILHGVTADVIANLTGQPDCWSAGVGGSGWVANTSGTASRFNARVGLDVIAPGPDVIWEMGGLNDTDQSQVTLQPLVEAWLGQVTAALPNVIVLMCGPMIPGTARAGIATVRDAKAAAAAKFPRNVRFIDNLAQGWTTGTGRQGTVVGDGNADWITGADTTHPTAEGHVHNAARFVAAAGAALESFA